MPAEPLPEHRDLVTQRDNLRLQGRSGAEQITQGAEEKAEHWARGFLQARPASMMRVRMRFSGGTESVSMDYVKRKSVLARACALGATLTLSGATAHAELTLTQKCESGKNGTVGKYTACLSKAQAKLAAGAMTEAGYHYAVVACSDRYNAKWHSLEAASAGMCPTNDDDSAIQGFVDACIFSAQEALAGDPLIRDVVACNTELDACQDDLATTDVELTACLDLLGCGDSVLDADEDCEIGSLDGETCATLGFAGGALRCAPGCSFDTSECYATRLDATGPTIIDHDTGLEWEKKQGTLSLLPDSLCPGGAYCGNPHHIRNLYAWSDGGTSPDGAAFTTFLAGLNGSLGSCYADHCDWRLPTANEWLELPWPRPEFYPEFEGAHWTRSTSDDNAALALIVYVGAPTLATTMPKSSPFPVRAVRSTR